MADYWIVDIKSLNPLIYEKYTGCRSGVLQHLCCLSKMIDDKSKVTIKVPHIPDFNDINELYKDIDEIKECYEFPNVIIAKYYIK